ncbi:putative RNA-binding protein EIF1AD [Helianthus annuus]|nr:putative RNA-binding protein EIF1AD [Helianthus annuus]
MLKTRETYKNGYMITLRLAYEKCTAFALCMLVSDHVASVRFSLFKNHALKICFCDARIYTRNVSDCGSFVVVDDGGREQAIESGRKVACVVLQVLFHDQVRVLQKSPEWLVYIY